MIKMSDWYTEEEIQAEMAKIEAEEREAEMKGYEQPEQFAFEPLQKNYSDMTWQEVLNDKVILGKQGFKRIIYTYESEIYFGIKF